MKVLNVILCSFFFAGCAYFQKGQNLKTGCAAYEGNFDKEFAIWKNAPQTKTNNSNLETNQLAKLQLDKEKNVVFTVPPEKKLSEDSDRFAGVFRFEAAESGVYSLSANKKVWLDVVDSSKLKMLSKKSSEMQPQCESIFKVVNFELNKGTKYVIQINGSQDADVSFLISSTGSIQPK